MTISETIYLFVESPDGERFECDVPQDTPLSHIAADFFEDRGWPMQDSRGRGYRAVVELVDPNNPDRTKRLRGELKAEEVLWNGAILRIHPESIAGPRLDEITWLHLSDLHFRKTPDYDYAVLTNSLLQDITQQAHKGLRPDFIVITGDLTLSGRSEEYEIAAQFLDKLLEATGISKERLFIVPGNHDIDRLQKPLESDLFRSLLQNSEQVNQHLTDSDSLDVTMSRFRGYAEFINNYFKGVLEFSPEKYFYVCTFSLAGLRVAVLGLNSAWMAQGDSADRGNLLLGEKQVWEALDRAADVDLKIALFHHPLDWLREFDRKDSGDALLNACDFVLHGHTHQGQVINQTSLVTHDNAIVIASGMGHGNRSQAGSYNIVQLDLNTGKGRIHLRQYSGERGGYENANSISSNSLDGEIVFDLPRADELLEHAILRLSLKEARRRLALLEERAAAFTALTRPVNLQIELEDERRKVAVLEAKLLSGDSSELLTFESTQTSALEQERRKLKILDEQAAGYGFYVPPHLKIELEDTRQKVAAWEAFLNGERPEPQPEEISPENTLKRAQRALSILEEQVKEYGSHVPNYVAINLRNKQLEVDTLAERIHNSITVAPQDPRVKAVSNAIESLEYAIAIYTTTDTPVNLIVDLQEKQEEIANLQSRKEISQEFPLRLMLKRAQRALKVLEQQISVYGQLAVPPHLMIEVEDKRREVADLEKQLKNEQSVAVNSNEDQKWAILIGINECADPTFPKLAVPINDAVALQKQLVVGGFDRSCIRMITDNAQEYSPTREVILRELNDIVQTVDEGGLLLFYFSGHATVHNNEGYLIAQDTQFQALEHTAISGQDLKALFSASRARTNIVILDTGYAGSFTDMAGSNIVILAACKEDQQAYEWQQMQLSVFTYYLLEALSGKADIDGTGFVTVLDIFQYVGDGVRRWASEKGINQTPVFKGAMTENAVLASVTPTHKSLLKHLSSLVQDALLWAEGFRQAAGAMEIYTEYILAGLYQDVNGLTRQLLSLFYADVPLQSKLRELANRMTSTTLQLEEITPATPEQLETLSLSAHAWEALSKAESLAAKGLGLSFPATFPISFTEGVPIIYPQHLLAGLLDTPASVASEWLTDMLQIERETLYRLLIETLDVQLFLDQVRRTSALYSQLTESVWYLGASLDAVSNSRYTLFLSLSQEYLTSNSLLIQSSEPELSVRLLSEGWIIPEGEDVVTFTLSDAIGTLQEVEVELVPRMAGYHTITIEPYSVTRQYPSLPLAIEVQPIAPQAKTSRLTLPDPTGPRPAPQPDLVLRVYRQPVDDSRFRLDYVLYSPHPQLHLTGIPVRSVEVTTTRLTALRSRLERLLRQHQGAELQSGLNALGRELYTLLFSKGEDGLASLYNDIVDQVQSWLVLDDADPWIPWELVKPHGPGWEHDFLGARYAIGRWIEGWGAVRQAEYPLGQVNTVAASSLSQQDAKAWTHLLDADDVPRLGKDLFVDWPGGYPAAMQYASPVWGLHFEGYPDKLARRLGVLATVDEQPLSTEEIKDHWLDFRRKAPLVTFGQVRLDGRSALTDVENKWMPTFIRAGASAFVSTYWATDPQVDRLFWRAFYQAIWQRTSLGKAVQQARQVVRQAFPDSMDWLAYFLVGDPMARGYVPRPGEGYTSLECLNHDLERPMQIGQRYVFRATLRPAPPPWYHGRRYEAPEAAWENPQLLVFAHGFTIKPGIVLPFAPPVGDVHSLTFEMFPERCGEHDVFVKFLDGDEVRHTLSFTAQVVAGEVA